jgi:hypothetical protein
MVNLLGMKSLEGQVFLIPLSTDRFIVAQVGRGEDLGVFDLTCTKDEVPDLAAAHILFRVNFGRKSPSHFHWRNAGTFALHPDLRDFAPYGHNAIGDTTYYRVTYEPREEEISKAEFESLEPLASWSHLNIVDRFTRETKPT